LLPFVLSPFPLFGLTGFDEEVFVDFCGVFAGEVGGRDGRRADLRIRGGPARRADAGFHDGALGTPAPRAAGAAVEPDHQRGEGGEPGGL